MTSAAAGVAGWLGGLFSADEAGEDEPSGRDEDRSGSVPLPPNEPAAGGGPAERVAEVVSQRSEHATVFELSNGQFEAEISTDPVHYRDGDGNWQEIETSVTATDGDDFAFESSTNQFDLRFGQRSDRLVRVAVGERAVTMGVAGKRRDLEPEVDGDTVRYADVFGSADVQYRVTSEGLKEEIVLEEAPEDSSFVFTLRMDGVVARELDDGSIGFFRPGQELAPVFAIPKPFMYDSADEPGFSGEVTQSVTQTGANIEITVTADQEWLESDDRVYPAVIDPTVIVEPTPTQGQDAMVRKAAPTTNYGESWQLGVGTDSVGAARSLLRFDVSAVPDDAVIDSAQVKVWYDQAYYTNANAVPLQLRRVTGAWDESTVTWNSASGLAGEHISGATKAQYVNSVWHSYDARSLVQGWVDGSITNHGVLLRAADESTLRRGGAYYEAAEYAYNGGPHVNRPKLVITYGEPSTVLEPITTTYSTGPELSWEAYAGSGDLVEYQVHRSIFQTFTPSAATLVSPVDSDTTTFTDTTAEPTPADDPDPFGNAYYWMVAVKLADGTVVPSNTQLARLPKAGHVKKIIRGTAVDTTLSKGKPTTNFDVFDNEPWLAVGDNGGSFGVTRALVKFPDLADELPDGATVYDADLKLWKPITFGSRGPRYDVHAVTRDWDETTATWNQAKPGVAWSRPGGDYDPAVVDYVPSIVPDPKFHLWWIEDLVQQWVDDPASNHGALIKTADESVARQMVIFDSTELDSEPQLRPQLHVTYTVPTAESTYYAPDTPKSTTAGEQRTVPVTITNTTDSVLSAADHVLSYHWAAADGTEVTSSANRLETALPANLAPGESVTVDAAVKAPQLSEPTNKREEFTLSWDVRNTASGQWMSQSRNVPALDQSASVAAPTSNQIGLEKFYQYTGTATGAGSSVLNNLFAGNTVWSYDAFSNPSRGVSTFVRLTYNSLDTSNSAIGYGWSLSTSTLMRAGTPLDFHPRGQDWPTQVTLTDGDGTAHLFTLNKHDSSDEADWTYDSPHGVHLYLQKTTGTDPTRAWVLTSPDRTEFHFDADGYQTALADRNGNELEFTYQNKKSNNKPIKFLRYITDPDTRETLNVDYYAKGDDYTFIDDTGAVQQGTKLTNPKIIDQVKTITDISGRKIEFVYTEKGLLGQFTDGAGDDQAKVFGFTYDAQQGNKNVKLVEVADPRGNATELSYYDAPTDPKAKWLTETITDRAGATTGFEYVDPDGPGGDTIETTVTDAEDNATFYRMDGYGRPVVSTNANDETTELGWDDDHNVIELVEANGATTTWEYDSNTGYPTLITDAEANANDTAGTELEYDFSLDGHVADLVAKTSPEGRRWEFGYNSVGNLTSVVDPAGTTTTDVPDDYTTTYSYDGHGMLATVTDANGNTTTYPDYAPTGYPTETVDALGNATTYEYDSRGNPTKVTDANDNTSSYSWDAFGRPLESQVPKDTDNDVYIVTPAPTYDGNDNVTKATAPNGAVTTYDYDAADRVVSTTLPGDDPDDADAPDRVASYAYDLVGNLIAETEPNGNLTADDPDDFVTRYGYDSVYQLISATNADDGVLTYDYDDVGNVTTIVDPRKNASSDPDGVTTTSTYDLNHQVTTVTDAAGHTSSTSYDLDGQVVETTDKQGATTIIEYDPRGLVSQVQVPHENTDDDITYRTTRYEYDQAGNRTRVISPRGTETADVADDFVHETVYDELNRVIEQIHPHDPSDPDFDTPDTTVYAYDKVGNLTKVSAPPSDGQSARNDTSYAYFDNGWIQRSVDAWDITTSYDYNELGQQSTRTLTSAGGSDRTMSWAYTLDGKLASRSDDGVPVGTSVRIVDDSDAQNVTTSGTWTETTTGSDYTGLGYRTHQPADGDEYAQWNPRVNADGTYEVWARIPAGHTGLASAAEYTITHADGDTNQTIDQAGNAGTWVSLGSYEFTRTDVDQGIQVTSTSTGTVAADAVKLVRDASGEVDEEAKTFGYSYDANGNLTGLTDTSSGAQVDEYAISYTGLNQVAVVEELNESSVVNTTRFSYDMNGNPLTTTHDDTHAAYAYDVRDLVEQVTNADTPDDPDPDVTEYTYTPNGWTATEVKPNGNTVEYDYYLDGLVRHQLETKADGTTVAEHTLTYDPNGNKTTEVSQVADADTAGLRDRTYAYTYDPRDRITELTKTDTSSGASLSSESYVHDAASNVISQTIDGTTTTYAYDRNRLLTATTGGVTAGYNYDPFGRLDTVVSAGQVVQRYDYDGFDRIIGHESMDQTGATETTTYAYDPLDRTASTTTDGQETTEYSYLGLSGDVLSESIGAEVQRSYQYSPWGKRLSQITHNTDDGGAEPEVAFYGYNTRTDVETLTDEDGDPISTYGYTAYGNNDDAEFTGLDKPDAGTPGDEPYNVYRYSAKRWNPGSGTYDMGFRDYAPGLNRFLSRDMYNGALADLNLTTSPWNGNRYAFTGGNPISRIEVDGHAHVAIDGGGISGGGSTTSSVGPSGDSDVALTVPPHAPPVLYPPGTSAPGGGAARGAGRGLGGRVLGWLGPVLSLGGDSIKNEVLDVDVDEQQQRCSDAPAGLLADIHYHDLDDRGRATGAEACLRGPVGKEHRDTRARHTPPGYIDGMHRGHLIANRFGGENNEPRNIVPLYEATNLSTMKRIENRIAKMLNEGQTVYYFVAPVYSAYADDQDIPIGVGMYAYGSHGTVIDEFVPNKS